ncbi:MAG: hypothetical protein M1823_002286 [Watsoniomyces obsoletus]|nr:MAG: hypothetical protein M1823_002286 [Watsoniomyces obsoletus]
MRYSNDSRSSLRQDDSIASPSFDEDAMARQLEDVDSSFLPVPSITSLQSEENLSEVTLSRIDYRPTSSKTSAPQQIPSSSVAMSPSVVESGTNLSLPSLASGITGLEWPSPGWEKVPPPRQQTSYFEDPNTTTAAPDVAGPSRSNTLPKVTEEKVSQDKENVGTQQQRPNSSGKSSSSSNRTSNASGPQLKAPANTIKAPRVRNSTKPNAKPELSRVSALADSPCSFIQKNERRFASLPKGLTLKEQGSTIDRLQKENFDLKLKIHFLNKSLDERSDEHIQATINKNAELHVILAKLGQENKQLRKRIEELEAKLKEQESRPNSRKSSLSGGSGSGSGSGSGVRYADEEVVRLREVIKDHEAEIEQLKDTKGRKAMEQDRQLNLIEYYVNTRRPTLDKNTQKEIDMWKNLYESECNRRRESDHTIESLEAEVAKIKKDSNRPNQGHQRKTSNDSSHWASQYKTEDYGTTDRHAASQLAEQLQQENDDLRREVSAQASMLTSRNREKDKLYQEIEELKLGQLQAEASRPVAGEQRRAQRPATGRHRSASDGSNNSRASDLSSGERMFYDSQVRVLRDDMAALKIKNHALETKLDECLDELEQLDKAKVSREKEFENALQAAARELHEVNVERDESMAIREELENEFESLKQEAQREITSLEADIEQKTEEVRHVRRELNSRTERLSALQAEMRSLNNVVVRLEDDQRASSRRIQTLQQELHDANTELDAQDHSLRDAQVKIERLTVQQESSQGEVAFLREEQDTDKMKIGELESSLERTTEALQGELEHVSQLEERITDERRQHEQMLAEQKQTAEQTVAELSREATSAKEEVRTLKKIVATKTTEVEEARELLEEFETNIRDALGETGGSRSSLVRSAAELHRDYDAAVAELESAKSNLADRERILRHRDGLLESAGLESRKLSEMLEKERQGRRTDRHHYEQLEKSSRQALRSATQQEARVLELESARQSDRKKLNHVENQYKDQLLERNNLVLALWNRLSTLCGSEWTHKHSQIRGKLPSIEVVSAHFGEFSKNLLLAVKTTEGVIGGFKLRIRSIEKDLWRDYQTLEHTLDARLKRLDRVEALILHGEWNTASSSSAENAKLRNEIKALRGELTVLQNDMPGRSSPQLSRAPSGPVPTRSDINQTALAAFTRHYSTSAVDALGQLESNNPSQVNVAAASSAAAAESAPDQRWIKRLKELEKRLKAEREARLLDRSGARQRLEEGRAEYEELKQELERERNRKA